MAGGTWDAQNKKQPGFYLNMKSTPTTLATIGDRGTVAIAHELSWGAPSELVTIENISDTYSKLGFDITSDEMFFMRQIFRGTSQTSGASKVLFYRLDGAGGVKAKASLGLLTMTAKYAGSRGNDVYVTITPDLDTEYTPETPPTSSIWTRDESQIGGTEAVINFSGYNATLSGSVDWYPEDIDLERAAGNRVGFLITPPADVTDFVNGTYTYEGHTGLISEDASSEAGKLRWFPMIGTPDGQLSIAVKWNEDRPLETFTVVWDNVTLKTEEDMQTQGDPVTPASLVVKPAASPIMPVALIDENYAVYIVDTVVDGLVQDSQRIGTWVDADNYTPAKIGDIQDNDWVVFTGPDTGEITSTAGINLLGGEDPVVTNASYSQFLTALEPESFNILIYDGTDATIRSSFASFVQSVSYGSGRYCQLVTSDYASADNETVISVKNGLELNDGTIMTPAQATWWVGGAEAGAANFQSLTYAVHPDAVRAVPALSSSERDAAIDEGSLAFIEEFGAVKIMTDINTFTSFNQTKGRPFSRNQAIRVLFSIANDLYVTFSLYYIGKVQNTDIGRNLFKQEVIGYCNQLQGNSAIQNFTADDVEVLPGIDEVSIVVNLAIQIAYFVEKIYMTVTVS